MEELGTGGNVGHSGVGAGSLRDWSSSKASWALCSAPGCLGGTKGGDDGRWPQKMAPAPPARVKELGRYKRLHFVSLGWRSQPKQGIQHTPQLLIASLHKQVEWRPLLVKGVTGAPC